MPNPCCDLPYEDRCDLCRVEAMEAAREEMVRGKYTAGDFLDLCGMPSIEALQPIDDLPQPLNPAAPYPPCPICGESSLSCPHTAEEMEAALDRKYGATT
ncbi:hypothetical protein [Parasphingopyxis sp.]|uniref:hypothetical protein n=1 Tax=Parasphingopyxis sp. TaxID=1920299 RepID=UPI0026018EDD|nr:hypothetical protein [Parasphingopyxis sp.]